MRGFVSEAIAGSAMIAVVACVPSARSADAPCGSGSTVIGGACVSYRVADAFCGKAASPARGGGCARKACGVGEALDTDHGLCLPESTVIAFLSRGSTRRDNDENQPKRRGTCLYGTLASRSGQLSCAMGPLSCGRGERFLKDPTDGGSRSELAGKCEALPPCDVGELYDEAASRCMHVVRNGVVDVGTWARLAIGTDGAEGTNAFCAPVRLTGARARFQVQLGIRDNDVTQATAQLTARPGTQPVASDAAERSLEQLTEILHDYGGSSLAASVSLEVSCTPPNPATPTLDYVQEPLDAGRDAR